METQLTKKKGKVFIVIGKKSNRRDGVVQCFSTIFFCDPHSFKNPICKNRCDPTK